MSYTLPPSLAHEGEPEATITRTRHGYSVNVTWGIMGLTGAPWWRPTRKSAERKARRLMRWWKAQAGEGEKWTVTL